VVSLPGVPLVVCWPAWLVGEGGAGLLGDGELLPGWPG